WSMSSPLPVASASAAIASDGARIYLVGGISSGEASASVLVARDSSTREWSHATELPSARVDHGLVLSAGALYVVGGRDALGAEATSSVLRATLGADGAIEAWADERPLPDPSPVLAAFVHGGRLYAIAPDRVFVSIANEDGLGPWVRIEVPLPVGGEPGIAHAAEAVFVVGGEAPDGTPGTDVFAAELTEDGGLAPWRRVSALPEGRAGLGALAIDEEIAVVGGAIEGDAPPPSLLARHCVR
ncbi:MAG: hypothetical protein IT379_40190, partial [Deltaproteobacteria bacterium]|nr:hypothetical protein [Deltaproteobacteria bacterium]